MRNLSMEAAIWNLFASPEFFEAVAQECEQTMHWFGNLAVSRELAGFGRNNQIYDKFKQRAKDFRRGAELARLGDFKFIWDISDCIRGDVRGMMEQALHSWMTEAEYLEFSDVRVDRVSAYARRITTALNSAMTGADSFFSPDPECPERSQDDDGFPGDEIIESYKDYVEQFGKSLSPRVPDPLPEYTIDRSTACKTGDEVPWTGVWYPGTGLDRHSLTFAIKGSRMQPVYQVIKTVEELESESDSRIIFSPQTVAVATTWHPVIPSVRQVEPDQKLRAKAGEPCPRAGIWEPTDEGAVRRAYQHGETMANLGSAYGLTVWRWVADR